jgi:hypothetical protein
MKSNIPLSEAVLLGAPELALFYNSSFVSRNPDGSVCSGCLVAAALKAVGDKHGLMLTTKLRLLMEDYWPWAVRVRSGFSELGILELLTNLMGDHKDGRLTLAQVADEIRKLEVQYGATESEQESASDSAVEVVRR